MASSSDSATTVSTLPYTLKFSEQETGSAKLSFPLTKQNFSVEKAQTDDSCYSVAIEFFKREREAFEQLLGDTTPEIKCEISINGQKILHDQSAVRADKLQKLVLRSTDQLLTIAGNYQWGNSDESYWGLVQFVDLSKDKLEAADVRPVKAIPSEIEKLVELGKEFKTADGKAVARIFYNHEFVILQAVDQSQQGAYGDFYVATAESPKFQQTEKCDITGATKDYGRTWTCWRITVNGKEHSLKSYWKEVDPDKGEQPSIDRNQLLQVIIPGVNLASFGYSAYSAMGY